MLTLKVTRLVFHQLSSRPGSPLLPQLVMLAPQASCTKMAKAGAYTSTPDTTTFRCGFPLDLWFFISKFILLFQFILSLSVCLSLSGWLPGSSPFVLIVSHTHTRACAHTQTHTQVGTLHVSTTHSGHHIFQLSSYLLFSNLCYTLLNTTLFISTGFECLDTGTLKSRTSQKGGTKAVSSHLLSFPNGIQSAGSLNPWKICPPYLSTE